MRFPKKSPAPPPIAGVNLFLGFLALLSSSLITPLLAAHQLVILSASDKVRCLDSGDCSGDAQRTSTSKIPTKLNPEPQPDFFFPLTPGTWWLYRGTVRWTDSDTNRPAATQATIKMQ